MGVDAQRIQFRRFPNNKLRIVVTKLLQTNAKPRVSNNKSDRFIPQEQAIIRRGCIVVEEQGYLIEKGDTHYARQ